MEKNLICSFFGQLDTDITYEIYDRTEREIARAINFGCNTFYFGSYDTFELLCHTVLTNIMREYPELNLRRVYYTTYQDYSTKILPNYKSKQPLDTVLCITQPYRTYQMIADSSYLIFFAKEDDDSLPSEIYRYAKTKAGKTAVNLYE